MLCISHIFAIPEFRDSLVATGIPVDTTFEVIFVLVFLPAFLVILPKAFNTSTGLLSPRSLKSIRPFALLDS